MTATPEVPINPEMPPAPESGNEIPREVEKGQMVQQQPVTMPRPTTSASAAVTNTVSTPTVTVPADSAQLTTLAKGNPVNAITWFANFWLRIIKKAIAAGSSIMTSQSLRIPLPTNPSNTTTPVSELQVPDSEKAEPVFDPGQNAQTSSSDVSAVEDSSNTVLSEPQQVENDTGVTGGVSTDETKTPQAATEIR